MCKKLNSELDFIDIINDYKTHNMTLEMIAKKNSVPIHKVLDILHKATVVIPNEIELCKKIIKDIKC